MWNDTQNGLRPLLVLDENKLTTLEKLQLRRAGFELHSALCAYCGRVAGLEPHWGCDAALEQELKFTGPIRQAVAL